MQMNTGVHFGYTPRTYWEGILESPGSPSLLGAPARCRIRASQSSPCVQASCLQHRLEADGGGGGPQLTSPGPEQEMTEGYLVGGVLFGFSV